MAGRKRSFDSDKVLDIIMGMFWRNGYVGTSMSDIVQATGLTKPSLYLAYGQKEDMFRKALVKYLHMQSERIGSALFSPELSTMDAIKAFLNASVVSATPKDGPKGCFVLTASGEAASASVPESVQSLISDTNVIAREMLQKFFSERSGDFANDQRTVEELSNYTLVLQSGLMQMAMRGLDRAALAKSVDLMTFNFPQSIEGLVREE